LVELRRQLDAGRFAVAWRSGVNVLVLASVLAAVIGLVIVFLLPPLLPLSMGPLYSITHLQAGFVAATIVLVPSLFMGSSLIYALNAYSSLFYANVIALVATVAFAWYAIQAYSLTGAVACAALAVSVRAAMMWWGVRRHVLMHERHLKDPSGTAARIGDI
jgi:O-antigen/teichoic acid export membrane protein